MALGREIDDRARPMRGQQRRYGGAIADVGAYEMVPGVVLERGQTAEIAGVGQLVDVEDGLLAFRAPVEHEIGADKSGAAGDQNHASSMRPKASEVLARGADSIMSREPIRRRDSSRDTTPRSAAILPRAMLSARIPSPSRCGRSRRTSPAHRPAAAAGIRGPRVCRAIVRARR